MTNEALDQFLEPGTRLTSGDRERIEELCNELYDFAFETCDNEMDFDGDEAGMIATNVQMHS